ncbi:YybH family protein [Aureibacter tunicatorum]|uniref:Ketosteroid isomerase-like protein n=1 Tax=Aureibacter tunicatorum TaxID=866807 RepID=A0AAE3XM84_9BACT|nr:nuclear transport factor 2 family protein [Aureibacter tunicatorum]MDR6239178.1 ketosteroid isomerase-like protein [Aureibacter tunicatorum]BDD04896.1 hypothetical protein AUTU_23790 [Aureibacter tunicatorum]
MKLFLILIGTVLITACNPNKNSHNEANIKTIKATLQEQSSAWNNGNMEQYMQGYWNSDSLMFIGKSNITYGWDQTLANYKSKYPDADARGILTFSNIDVKILSPEYAYVIGDWNLVRKTGNIGGKYTLLWKKIDDKWVIISDMTN